MKLKSYLSKPALALVLGMLSFSGNAEPVSELSAIQTLQSKLSQLTSYQADFTQTVVDIENTILQQAKGNISLQQPNKLYWELLPPNDNILIADGQTLWNLDAFMEQVVAYDQLAAIKNNPLILLTDPTSTKWQEYQVIKTDDQTDKVFVIKPTDQQTSVQSLTLTFDQDNKLVGLQTTDQQQQTSTLVFSNIKQDQPIDADMFVFTLPKGYELDDQRDNER